MRGQDLRRTTIASGGTTSDGLRLDDVTMGAISIPPLTACDLEIQANVDGTNWQVVKDSSGNQVGKWTGTTGDFIVDADVAARLVGLPAIRFVSSVAQGALRTFTVRALQG